MGNYSIVDYMKANGQDSSYNHRTQLAKQYGMNGYTGSANQNIWLLNSIRNHHSTTPTSTRTVSTINPKPVAKPQINPNDLKWWNDYRTSWWNGQNDPTQMAKYRQLENQFGLDKSKDWIQKSALADLSRRALNGDINAQNYLKAMKYQQYSGDNLWYGFNDPTKLQEGSQLWQQYLSDHGTSDYTKQQDLATYNKYKDIIMNGGQLSDDQKAQFQNAAQRWNMADLTDPYAQQRAKLGQDEQQALNAQDVALNQGLGAQDAANFQMFNQIAQSNTNRGIGDTGMGQDNFFRAQMGANQNYQQAFADSAKTKSDIKNQFDSAISQSKIDQQNNQQQMDMAQQKAAMDLQKMQNQQDQFLTSQTGMVYINGKAVTDSKGNPIHTVDWYKMSETQRHNMANEALTGQKNAQNYDLGNKKIAADLQKYMAGIKLDYAKLDFNYKKLDSQNAIAQDKIKVAIANANNAADRTKLTGLGKQLDTVTKQITALQKKKSLSKADKATLKKLVSKYNETNDAISKVVGGTSFNDGGKGSDSGGNYNNYYKTSSFNNTSAMPRFNRDMDAAIKKGNIPVTNAWVRGLTELAARESGLNPNAKNPGSTAHGYAQFLNGTVRAYKKRYPNLDYNNPVDQLILMYHYVKDRYHTPEEALKHWDEKKWY